MHTELRQQSHYVATGHWALRAQSVLTQPIFGHDEPESATFIFEPSAFADSLVALSVRAWARLTSVARRTRHRFLTKMCDFEGDEVIDEICDAADAYVMLAATDANRFRFEDEVCQGCGKAINDVFDGGFYAF